MDEKMIALVEENKRLTEKVNHLWEVIEDMTPVAEESIRDKMLQLIKSLKKILMKLNI